MHFSIHGGLNMLALSRKVGQTIVIGNQITVSILAIRGNRITLGIDAPKEISIHREELATSIFANALIGSAIPVATTPIPLSR